MIDIKGVLSFVIDNIEVDIGIYVFLEDIFEIMDEDFFLRDYIVSLDFDMDDVFKFF